MHASRVKACILVRIEACVQWDLFVDLFVSLLEALPTNVNVEEDSVICAEGPTLPFTGSTTNPQYVPARFL
jgi:hypothetical protein